MPKDEKIQQNIEGQTPGKTFLQHRRHKAQVNDEDGTTTIVLVIECRLTSVAERQSLIIRLQQLVYMAFGVNCVVELVPPHTLPRTSSGKLSRFAARQGYIQRTNLTGQLSFVESGDR